MTFRLGDALPQEKLSLLKRLRADWELKHPEPRSERDWEDYAREFTARAERWLDQGYGACHFRQRRWVDDLRERLHYFQDERYFLSCWAITPNHCHLVIRPLESYLLEDLIGAMKAFQPAISTGRLGRLGVSGRRNPMIGSSAMRNTFGA